MGEGETDCSFWTSIIRIKVWECSAGSVLKMIDGMRFSEVEKRNIAERRKQRDN
ncbi:MAG TPA: hypothetical protein VMV04_13370 [Thermodesulfobacteriota bacterium]|nr:hypothetical protein [Thermodesulfobacteriota bacterium]